VSQQDQSRGVASGRPETPTRSTAQRLEALRNANAVRSGRAQLKKELATGTVMIADILIAPPQCATRQKVHDLLLALPGYGPARVARLLTQCRISPSKTVAGLSDRQRTELASRLYGNHGLSTSPPPFE
jgi:hypothetical protein